MIVLAIDGQSYGILTEMMNHTNDLYFGSEKVYISLTRMTLSCAFYVYP
jgi:hypothetical protein